MTQIIGDPGKRRRYDPDLARKLNEEVERERKQAERKSKLEAEVESTEPKIQPATPADLEAICKGYEEFMGWSDDRSGKIPTEITNKFNPTKEQVLGFSRKLIEYNGLSGFTKYTANYLTALMYLSRDKEFVLDLTELSKQGILLSFLGYKIKNKKLTINGNVGDNVGFLSKGCLIRVNGNVEDNVGQYAENSKIYIKGNIRRLSDKIGNGTEIYQWENEDWVKKHPQ